MPVNVAPDTGNEEPANFLLIGSDSRGFVDDPAAAGAFGDPNVQTGQRSDTLMVIRVDPKNQTAYVVSFPRDLIVDIPGVGRDRINRAFNYGEDKVIETLKANFGIDIQHYLEIGFDGFRGIVDSLGGVEVYFAEPATDPCSTFDLEPPVFKRPGLYKLDGDTALLYVRSRYLFTLLDGRWQRDPIPDTARIERQQDFIRRVAAEAVKTSIANPITGVDVSDKTIAKLKIDEDLTRGDINKLINGFRNLDPNNPSSLEMTTIPWMANPASSATLLVNDAAAAPVLAALRGEAPPPPPDAPPPRSNATPGASAPAATAPVTVDAVPTPPGPSVCRE